MITFRKVTESPDDIRLLFDLLAQRQYSISHTDLPNFDHHADFVRNHPYRHWAFVYEGDHCVGSFYIQNDNTIGLNLSGSDQMHAIQVIKEILALFDPLPPIKSVRPKGFVMNVPIGNHELHGALKDDGYQPIQTTFRLSDGGGA